MLPGRILNYIYNVGQDAGFIMVSGDDRVDPVIGYGLSGSFDAANMPANMKAWLGEYERQIDYARTLPEQSFPEEASVREADPSLPARVEPLIKTKWHQTAPYNDLCPMVGDERTVTGCVATAIAQIMNYHRWPEQAVGTGSYTIPALGDAVTTVDLNGITFDWDNMADTYGPTSASTPAQCRAVAELMYAAGAAVNMMYGVPREGSGAVLKNGLTALVRNMGYDENVSYLYRSFFSKAEWYALMKKELAEGRPIYYTGQSASSGGHAFVCDGYDDRDFFHINWGWAGSSDNYFKLDLLYEKDPSSNLLGYSGGQSAIVGIQKPTPEGSERFEELRMAAVHRQTAVIPQGGTMELSFTYQYSGALPTREVEHTFELFQNGLPVATLMQGVLPVQFDSYYHEMTITIPNVRLAPGRYDLVGAYRFKGETEWKSVSMVSDSYVNWPSLFVDEAGMQWVVDAYPLVGEPIALELVNAEKSAWKATTTLRNLSDKELLTLMNLYIFTPDSSRNAYVGTVCLLPGEEKEVEFSLTLDLPPGSYSVELTRLTDFYENLIQGTSSTFVVPEEETSVPTLEADGFEVLANGRRIAVRSDVPLDEVCVFDSQGRSVCTGSGTEIHSSDLAAGVYTVCLRAEGKVRIVKAMVY